MNALTDDTAEDTQAVSTEVPDTADTSPAAKKERAPTERIVYDEEAGTCSFCGATYHLSAMPAEMHRTLALRGMAHLLHTARDPDKTFATLKEGRLAVRGPAVPKEPSDWHKAIALAKIEAAKKAGSPISADEAARQAAAMSQKERATARKHPLVLKHYGKLTGASDADILAMGV